ncbi:hypothetical protein [Beijerinckia sp. L45]|uniref:hypothetical protein n=1 Tax=Beijerinckia sp. L45 TaxID=1641855 RepID=UPI00131EB97A|nr:hypothetical protein [Beijerinckia sp. L45]
MIASRAAAQKVSISSIARAGSPWSGIVIGSTRATQLCAVFKQAQTNEVPDRGNPVIRAVSMVMT